MAVDGDRLYYANGGEGLHILDISTPLAPTHLSRDLEANTTARDVAASGTTAVLAFDKGLRLFEVSDPANPVHLRDVSCIIDALDDDPHGLEVAGDLAYVADNRQEALVVVDISRQDVR